MQDNQVKKERKPMTPEQIEALKARLMKAREAKIERDKKRYEYNKEEVKTEAIKKRALTKVKKLVDAGTLKEEELQKVIPGSLSHEAPRKLGDAPMNKEVKQEVKEVGSSSLEKKVADVIPFEEPLPSKPINIPKPGSLSHEAPRKLGDAPKKIPDVIPFEEPLPQPKKSKDKDRFLKIVYYKEPSKAALKKLQKIQESSSDDESSDEEPANNQNVNQTTTSTEDDYYRSLARQFFN